MSEYKEYRLPLGRGSLTFRLVPKEKPVPEVQADFARVSEGLMPPDVYEEDLIPRRRKVSGFVNFYDCGQRLVDGAWTDLPYFLNGGFTANGPNSAGIANFPDWPLLLDVVKQVPFEDWRTHYRKITYETMVLYGLADVTSGFTAIEVGYSKWTPQGYKIEGSAFEIEGSASCYSMGLGYNGVYKVTTTEDYNADPVALNLNGPTDVFLLPAISNKHGWTRPIRTRDGLVFQDVQDFWPNFAIVSRQRFLAGGWLKQEPPAADYQLPGYDDFLALLAEWEILGGPVYDYLNPSTVPVSSDFPAIISEIFLIETKSIFGDRTTFPFNPVGSLQAVVMQGNNIYYVWREGFRNAIDYAVIINETYGYSI